MKPKGILALAIGKPKPDGEEPSGEGDRMEDAKMTAAQDAMDAFKSGDAAMFSDALARHYEACQMAGGYGDEE